MLSPSNILYLDHSSEPSFDERGLNWATEYSNSRKIFEYSPPDNENIQGKYSKDSKVTFNDYCYTATVRSCESPRKYLARLSQSPFLRESNQEDFVAGRSQ